MITKNRLESNESIKSGGENLVRAGGLFQFQSQSQLSIILKEQTQIAKHGQSEEGDSITVDESELSPLQKSKKQIDFEMNEEKERFRQERAVVAQSMIIEKRDKEFETVKTIDMVNKSLEVEQLRLMKQF